MLYLIFLIIAFIILGLFDLYAKKNLKKSRALKQFTVRTSPDVAFIGALGLASWIAILIFGYATGFKNNQGEYIGDHPFVWTCSIIIGVGCIFTMSAPIKGVWDVIVDNDDISVVKGFLYKRHWKFSNIAYAKICRGGAKIYVYDKKRKAFFIDGMCEGYTNFLQRMEKENKEIIW